MNIIQKQLLKIFALRLLMIFYYGSMVILSLYLFTQYPTKWLIVLALGNVPIMGAAFYNAIKTARNYAKQADSINNAIRQANRDYLRKV
jgi:cytochrome c biogenesis protein CcdA